MLSIECVYPNHSVCEDKPCFWMGSSKIFLIDKRKSPQFSKLDTFEIILLTTSGQNGNYLIVWFNSSKIRLIVSFHSSKEPNLGIFIICEPMPAVSLQEKVRVFRCKNLFMQTDKERMSTAGMILFFILMLIKIDYTKMQPH